MENKEIKVGFCAEPGSTSCIPPRKKGDQIEPVATGEIVAGYTAFMRAGHEIGYCIVCLAKLKKGCFVW